MNQKKFKAIIYLIAFTALVTVGIQVYRNVQNYELNKQRFINDVQAALDNSIEGYFASLAKNFILLNKSDDTLDKRELNLFLNGIKKKDSNNTVQSFAFSSKNFSPRDSSIVGLTIKKKGQNDSLINFRGLSDIKGAIQSISIRKDSIGISGMSELNDLTTKIVFSMTQDSINFEVLEKYIKKELSRKKLDIEYAVLITDKNGEIEQSRAFTPTELPLSTITKATYASSKKIELYFSNASMIILKRGMADLLISLLVSITVIGALLYLYKIINEQKQLAEIKNDLISNITHEFKTPIATVNSALEGISNFNEQNDREKTAKYVDISFGQLKKLNLMVEKLLETATLESESLEIRKEPLNLSQMLHTLIEKFKMVAGEKVISLIEQSQDIIIEADPFHIENAISNLIDNAIKYGGNEIKISLAFDKGKAQVIVNDNGGYIEKSQKERVFDKFYRIPTGNQHDVKGFGIGLYYTKKIIEKHGGSINLVLKPQSTSFEVAIS